MTVTGIAFETVGTISGLVSGARQVFPSADGAVEFSLDNVSGDWEAIPKAGEARFSEIAFDTSGDGNGDPNSRATLQEMSGDPILYASREPPSTSDSQVWRFDPVGASFAAVTETLTDVDIFDVSVRDYSGFGWAVTEEFGDSTYRVRRWVRSSEDPSETLTSVHTFAAGQQPENVDVDQDDIGWVSGDADGAGFVMRLDDDATTWVVPSGWNYVDGIQCVAAGEAIGTAANPLLGYANMVSFFRFKVGAANAVDITSGVTVDGQAYHDWTTAEGDNIDIQNNVKVAVLGEQVAALTDNGLILLGTLVRQTARWALGKTI